MDNLKPIVTALKLLESSKTLRRMYYSGLSVAVFYGLPAIIRALGELRIILQK